MNFNGKIIQSVIKHLPGSIYCRFSEEQFYEFVGNLKVNPESINLLLMVSFDLNFLVFYTEFITFLIGHVSEKKHLTLLARQGFG